MCYGQLREEASTQLLRGRIPQHTHTRGFGNANQLFITSCNFICALCLIINSLSHVVRSSLIFCNAVLGLSLPASSGASEGPYFPRQPRGAVADRHWPQGLLFNYALMGTDLHINEPVKKMDSGVLSAGGFTRHTGELKIAINFTSAADPARNTAPAFTALHALNPTQGSFHLTLSSWGHRQATRLHSSQVLFTGSYSKGTLKISSLLLHQFFFS